MQHHEVFEQLEQNPLEHAVSEERNLLGEAVSSKVGVMLFEAMLHARFERRNSGNLARKDVRARARIVERREQRLKRADSIQVLQGDPRRVLGPAGCIAAQGVHCPASGTVVAAFWSTSRNASIIL